MYQDMKKEKDDFEKSTSNLKKEIEENQATYVKFEYKEYIPN